MYLYKGQDESLLPALITAHQDVVPANKEEWIHPPFSGDIEDGFVYGRGSFDDKGSLIAILEAVEQLLEDGFIQREIGILPLDVMKKLVGIKGRHY